jgi:hypothetical protein
VNNEEIAQAYLAELKRTARGAFLVEYVPKSRRFRVVSNITDEMVPKKQILERIERLKGRPTLA